MRVYRLHYRNDPKRGPWYMDELDNILFTIMGAKPNYGAYHADEVATKLGVKRPSDHRGPTRDPILRDHEFEDADFGLNGDLFWYFGFQSLDQYAEWFVNPEVRKAVFIDNAIVLACYDVPDDYVIIGCDQVMFQIERATKEEIVPDHVAIYLTQ